MKDRRKVFFCLICLIITIISEIFLYNQAKVNDSNYKKMMKDKLKNVTDELEVRSFERKKDYQKGCLEYERNKEGYDYGYININYNIDGDISDVSIKLEYSDNLYIDDIFYDSYYIFNLLGINIENEYNFDSDIGSDFSVEDEIYINDNKYIFSITKQDNNQIQFEIK